MSKNIFLSYVGNDRPFLVSKILSFLDSKGGDFGDVSFASLGYKAGITMTCRLPEKTDIDVLRKEFNTLEVISAGDIILRELEIETKKGPSSRITHRFMLEGIDRRGLIKAAVEALDRHSAIVIRMNSERIRARKHEIFMVRFAVSMRKERQSACLHDMLEMATKFGMKMSYEETSN